MYDEYDYPEDFETYIRFTATAHISREDFPTIEDAEKFIREESDRLENLPRGEWVLVDNWECTGADENGYWTFSIEGSAYRKICGDRCGDGWNEPRYIELDDSDCDEAVEDVIDALDMELTITDFNYDIELD